MEFLQVTVEQGTPDNPKKESRFLQFLDNLHNTAKGKQLSFEMFGYNQYTYLFIGCDADITKLVEGLIYAAFPDCEIKPIKDYTRFFKSDKQVIMGTGAELTRSDIYPLKTYEEFEVDSLSGVFSVISKMEREEQAWVQILISPKDDNWSYHFGRQLKMRFNSFFRRLRLKNFVRMKNKKQFFAEEDAQFIDKADQNPFRIQLRFAAISDNPAKAKKNLLALAKAFYQFNKTDNNEFKMQKIKNGASFVREYRARKMNKPVTIGANELATIYHFPNCDHVPHVVHVLAKKHEPPKDLPTQKDDSNSLFGRTNYHNNFQDFGINRGDRRRHMYVVGKSGTGKSKMLELLIKNDILAGKGVGILDPHGDLVDNIMRIIPEHRKKDVVYFDPGDTEFPIAFNPLEAVDEKFKMQVTIGFIDIFKKLFGDNWSDRLEHVLRYTTLALLDSPNTTVMSILKMLSDKNYRQTIIARIEDSVVKNFWVNEFAGWSEKFDAEAITPLLNKVGQLVSTNMIRNIVGQPDNTFDIRDIMDGKKFCF